MAAPLRRLNTAQSEGQLSVSSKLSVSRRDRLMNLKKREEMKDALTEKFKGRFGHGGPGRAPSEVSVNSSAIRQEVDGFAGLGAVTSNNLGRLERRLLSQARPGGGSEVSAYSADLSNLSRSRSATSLAGAKIVGGGSQKETFDWSMLDQYASYLHEQDCVRQHMGVHALQKKLKLDLDQQVGLKERRKAEEAQEDKMYHVNSMLELERWKKMELLRDEEKKAKVMREKEDRDAQLAFERKLKSEDEAKRKNEEAALVTKIVSEMTTEQKRFEKKKDNVKKNMRKVFEENEKYQTARNIEMQNAKEKEAEQLKEYAKALDDQEKQRQAELQARMERQSSLMKDLQANVDGIKKGAGDNDANRAAAQQEEMDRHFFEAENVKQNRLKQLRLENQAYLLKQMEEKDGRRDGEKELSDIQAQILQRDSQEYNENERQKVANRRKELTAHSKDIKKQMAYKLSQAVPVMTDTEVKLNKPLLQLVTRTLESQAENRQYATIPEGDEEE